MAHVERSHPGQAADLSADAVSVLVLAGCLADMVAAGDDERGKPADPRRAAERVEVALEAGGVQHFSGVDGASTRQ